MIAFFDSPHGEFEVPCNVRVVRQHDNSVQDVVIESARFKYGEVSREALICIAGEAELRRNEEQFCERIINEWPSPAYEAACHEQDMKAHEEPA